MLKGKRVAERRIALGWGVARLSEKSGVTRPHIYSIEGTEDYNSGAKVSRALAEALGTTQMYLEGLTDDPEPLKIERLTYSIPNPNENSEEIFELLKSEALLIIEEHEINKRKQENLRKQREMLEGKNNST